MPRGVPSYADTPEIQRDCFVQYAQYNNLPALPSDGDGSLEATRRPVPAASSTSAAPRPFVCSRIRAWRWGSLGSKITLAP